MILVQDAMVCDIVSVDIETSLIDTCKIMGKMHIGSVLVTCEGKPVGIFTERDLLSKAVLKGVDLEKKMVREYMSKPLTVIGPKYELKEAARAMAQLNIRRLPVIDNGRLVGIITSADIVSAIAEMPLKI